MNDVSLNLAHEAELRLRKAGATAKNFWDPISKSEELAEKVVAFVVATLKQVFQLVASFDHDKQNDGWKLLSDSATKEGEFTPELAEFHKGREDLVGGEEMLLRAQALGDCAGQRHAEAKLRDPLRIPEEWKKYVLVFPSTVWQDSGGLRRVACLDWLGGSWYLNFYWLRNDFYRDCRLVRLCK